MGSFRFGVIQVWGHSGFVPLLMLKYSPPPNGGGVLLATAEFHTSVPGLVPGGWLVTVSQTPAVVCL